MRGKGSRRTTWWKRVIQWEREDAVEDVIRAMFETVNGHEAYCRNEGCLGRQRYLIVTGLAALFRDVAAGRAASIEREQACSSAVAALALMEAAGR